jgi:predicted flap endonuclease-1-like 5' DNA nuclease
MSSEQQRQNQMNAIFEMQRNAIQQSQQMMHQGVDMQQRMTESLLRNNLRAGQNAQRQGTELARNWVDTYFRALGTAFGQGDTSEVNETLDEQFEQFTDSQEEAWSAFEDSLDQAMTAYEDLSESQKELVDRSFTLFVDLQRKTYSRVAAAAYPWLARQPEQAVAMDTGETAETTKTGEAAEIAEQTTDEETEPDTSTDHAVTTKSDEPAASDETSTSMTESKTLDLQYLSGIGTAYKDRLEAVGITSVEALADADPEELASQTTLPEKRLREWIEQAKHHVQRS